MCYLKLMREGKIRPEYVAQIEPIRVLTTFNRQEAIEYSSLGKLNLDLNTLHKRLSEHTLIIISKK